MASAEHGASTRTWEGAPVRPHGGTQPHSLLHESVTSGDLHRPEPCFMSPDEDPARAPPLTTVGETRNQDKTKG